MTADRLERAVQSMHGIGMSLTTMVVAAIGADKVSPSFAFGQASHLLLHASLAFFVVSAVAGGHLITRLPMMDGELDEVMASKAPLIGGKDQGLLALRIGHWRQIQHWGLTLAVVLGLLGGLVTTTAEDLHRPAAAEQAR